MSSHRPAKQTPPYDIDATYDLLDPPGVTPDAIQHGHRHLVKEELRRPGRYLLIEDTTLPVLHPSQAGGARAGPDRGLGAEGSRDSCSIRSWPSGAPQPAQPDASGRRPPVTILGLVDQQYLVRSELAPSGQVQAGGLAAAETRDRESDRWLESSRRIGPAPPNPGHAGSASPIAKRTSMNILISCRDQNHGFLVRVNQDRVVLEPESGKRLGLVFEHIVRRRGALGGMYLGSPGPRRPGRHGGPSCC